MKIQQKAKEKGFKLEKKTKVVYLISGNGIKEEFREIKNLRKFINNYEK